MKDNCPCIQKPGANETSTTRDAGRMTGVTDTYGANLNADVIKDGKTATFKDAQLRSVNDI